MAGEGTVTTLAEIRERALRQAQREYDRDKFYGFPRRESGKRVTRLLRYLARCAKRAQEPKS